MAVISTQDSPKFGSNSQYGLRVTVDLISQDITNNTSTIVLRMYTLSSQSTGAYNLDDNNTVNLTLNGSTVLTSTKADLDFRSGNCPRQIDYTSGTTVYKVEYRTTVAHGNDGTKTIQVGGSIYYNTSSSSSLPRGPYPSSTWSASVALPTIPRSSSISFNKTSVAVGSSITTTITRASTSFTHTLVYSFKGETSTAATLSYSNQTTSHTFSVPDAWKSKMPTTKSGTCTVTCTTYNGNTVIGTSTGTFTVTAPDATTMAIGSPNAIDANSTTATITGSTSSSTVYIRGLSTARVSFTATPSGGSSIASAIVEVRWGSTTAPVSLSKAATLSSGTYTADFTSFASNTSETVACFRIAITDARGYSTGYNFSRNIRNYTSPSVSLSASRTTGTNGTVTVSGSVTKTITKANGSDSFSNTITLTLKQREYGGTWSTKVNGVSVTPSSATSYSYTYSATGLDTDTSYEFEVAIHDAVILSPDKTATKRIGSEKPAWEWDRNTFSHNTNVVFDNGDQLEERSIRYKNATDSTYHHNTTIYGGNPESQTSLGIWDSAHSHSVMYYFGNTGTVSFLEDQTAINRGADFRILGKSISWYQKFMQSMPQNTNLNDIIAPGIYHQSTSSYATLALNYPVATAGLLEVFQGASTTFIYQRYTTYAGHYCFQRCRYSNTWYPWHSLKPTEITAWGNADDTPNLNTLWPQNGYTVYCVVFSADATTAKNFPTSSSGFLEVMRDYSTSERYIQRFTTYNSSAVYIRHYYNSAWSAWKKVFPVVYSGTDPTTTGIHTATVSADFNSSGVASVTVSGVTTSSHVIAQRVATSAQTGNSWSVAAAVPTAANTVRLVQSSTTTASSVSINIIWW